MDEMAQRRAVMILGVLSGQVTVTDAIESTGISRGTYYKLEEKALKAMVRALLPGADDAADGEALSAAKRIEELQAKIEQLQQDKRRTERLQSLVTKIVNSGPMTTNKGPKKGSNRSCKSSPGKSDSTRTRGGEVGH
jgi:DNA replicative helicase MCM subunit Mcm2 (Cdc46/Mcm family)